MMIFHRYVKSPEWEFFMRKFWRNQCFKFLSSASLVGGWVTIVSNDGPFKNMMYPYFPCLMYIIHFLYIFILHVQRNRKSQESSHAGKSFSIGHMFSPLFCMFQDAFPRCCPFCLARKRLYFMVDTSHESPLYRISWKIPMDKSHEIPH